MLCSFSIDIITFFNTFHFIFFPQRWVSKTLRPSVPASSPLSNYRSHFSPTRFSAPVLDLSILQFRKSESPFLIYLVYSNGCIFPQSPTERMLSFHLSLLQIDAVSLFLLYLVEMICSGLQIIYNTDEVNKTLQRRPRQLILDIRDLGLVLSRHLMLSG